MAISSYTQFGNDQKKVMNSQLHQVIDVIQADISGSGNRRKYESFLSSSATAELTSSLYQTVYDQGFTLQTANPVLDMTVGLYHFDDGTISRNNLVTNTHIGYSRNTSGQLEFDPEATMMMREKVNIYRQYANLLLGNADLPFAYSTNATREAINESTTTVNDASVFDACMFINIKRLFSRDGIRKETFAMRLYEQGDLVNGTYSELDVDGKSPYIVADIGSNTDTLESAGGYEFGYLKKAANSTEIIGLIFYEPGIIVLNLKAHHTGANGLSTAFDSAELLSGSLSMGRYLDNVQNHALYPDLLVSGSIDNIIDYLANTRFGNGQLTGIAFQNNTNIQSSIYICRANIDTYNASNNPTWVNSMETAYLNDSDNWFTYITSVSLLDDSGEVVAVGKLNRPVYKDQDAEVSIRIRLDF